MKLEYKSNINLINAISIIIFFIFFSRISVSLGLPEIINHVHYLLVCIFFFYFFSKREKNIINLLLLIFILNLFLSGIFNSSSISNSLIYLFITLEPFLIYLIFCNSNFNSTEIKYIKKIIYLIGFLNLFFCYYQYLFIGLKHDSLKGIFLNLGAGHHITGFVSTLIALMIYYNPITKIKIINYLIILLLLSINIIADAKQIFLTFGLAILIFNLFLILNEKKILLFFKILLSSLFFLLCIYVMYQYTSFLDPYLRTRTPSEFINGFFTKFAVIEIINSYFSSIIDFFIGLGPGNTTSRLARMIPFYEHYSILNLSSSNITNEVFYVQQSNPITNTTTGSSLFNLFFFWGGLYGDTGIIGIVIYVLLWLKIFKEAKFDSISIILIILVFVKGFAFDWPEEPVFTTLVVLLIAIRKYENSPNTQ